MMGRLFKKLSTSLLAVLLICGVVLSDIPVYATEDENLSENGSVSMDVSYTVPECYTVSVPKKVVLVGENTPFNIKVKGDLEPNYDLQVLCYEDLVMSREGSSYTNTAKVTMADSKWAYSEINNDEFTVCDGNIEFNEKNPGNYTGVVVFDIELIGHVHEYINESNVVDSTCDTEGSKDVSCPCGDTQVGVVIEKKPHDFNSNGKCNDCGFTCVHDYESEITREASCTLEGIETYTCKICKYTYDKTLTKLQHSYSNNKCTECESLEPGLYNVNDVMLVNWASAGIDVEKNYTSSTCKTDLVSPYVVITETYPTATKLVLPDTVTKIGTYAFNNTTLTSIILTGNISTVGSYAFASSSYLKFIELYDVTSSMHVSTFRNTYFDTITMGNVNSISGMPSKIEDDVVDTMFDYIAYSYDTYNIVIRDGATKIPAYLCHQFSPDKYNYLYITLPDSIKTIEKYAFSDFYYMTSMYINGNCRTYTLPKDLETIDEYAFYFGSDSFSTIVLSDSIKTIGRDAFYGTELYWVTYKGTKLSTTSDELKTKFSENGVTVGTSWY